MVNHSVITEFIFLGFSNNTGTQWVVCAGFFIMYTLTLLGNGLIIVLTLIDSALHTPMYFFLRNLSFVEICYTSVTLPKMLANLISESKSISFAGCAAQMYFLLLLGTVECYLLAFMAYDRYKAICSPLHYPFIMNRKACTQMVVASWICGILVPLGNVIRIFTLPYCGPNTINHFFCDVPPVLKLACTDTTKNEITTLILSVLVTLLPFLLVLASYVRIIFTVVNMSSAEGRHRAFSTCSSHLIVVTTFYGSASGMYLRPKSSHNDKTDRLVALFYTIVTPMLNPLIYSLRNKEVNDALKRLRRKKTITL